MSCLDVFYDDLSIADFGLSPVERPTIPTPELREEFITIQGRDGSLVIPDAYNDVTVTIQYNILEDENIKPLIREVKGFLLGKKSLRFSDDDIFYKIKSLKIQETQNEIEEYGVVTIDHVCDPFQYDMNSDFISVSTGTTIDNPGTIESKPLYKVTGTGSATLSIDGETIELINLSGTIILDAELMNAYEFESNSNRNNNIRGIIPGIKTTGAVISYSGGITSLEVNGRWRYI